MTLQESEDLSRKLEDLFFVLLMTIDYLKKFKEKNPEFNKVKVDFCSEKGLQVDTIPDYEGIILKLRSQIMESEDEKKVITAIFAEKVELLNREIENLEEKCRALEEKRNETLELMKENVFEKELLREEIKRLGEKLEEKEQNNEDQKKAKREKYALIDHLHEQLKRADRANKLLAERLGNMIEKKKIEG